MGIGEQFEFEKTGRIDPEPGRKSYCQREREAEAHKAAIRAWIEKRILLGKNKEDDDQLVEAESCIAVMEEERERTAVNPMDAVMDRYMRGNSTKDDLEVMAAGYFTFWMANKKKEKTR